MTFSFDAWASGHTARNALRLGEAAALAYQPESAVASWAAGQGLESRCFDQGKVQGFVATNLEALLVVFRGTDQLEDWGINLNAAPELPESAKIQGLVHRGFYEALLRVWAARVKPELEKRGNRAVWIAGHSLGGALAALAAAHSTFIEGISVRGLYTYGQPRVGNQAFVEQFNATLGSRTFRYINDKDIVPRVPLMTMGYRHAGRKMFFTAAGTLVSEPSLLSQLHDFAVSEAHKIEEQLLGAIGGDTKKIFANRLEGIQDHSMDKSYLPRLKAAAGQ
jgi:triacylglycerol lipase